MVYLRIYTVIIYHSPSIAYCWYEPIRILPVFGNYIMLISVQITINRKIKKNQ